MLSSSLSDIYAAFFYPPPLELPVPRLRIRGIPMLSFFPSSPSVSSSSSLPVSFTTERYLRDSFLWQLHPASAGFSLVLSPVLLLPAPRHTCSSRGRIRSLVGERLPHFPHRLCPPLIILSYPDSLPSASNPSRQPPPVSRREDGLATAPETVARILSTRGTPRHATPRHYQQRERTRGRKVEREKERNSPRLHSTTPLEDSCAPERLRLRSHVLRAPKLGRNVVESSQEGKENSKKIRGVPSFVGHSQSSE